MLHFADRLSMNVTNYLSNLNAAGNRSNKVHKKAQANDHEQDTAENRERIASVFIPGIVCHQCEATEYYDRKVDTQNSLVRSVPDQLRE